MNRFREQQLRKYQNERRKKKILAAFMMTLISYEYNSRIVDRNVWVKHWVARRQRQGVHHNLFVELAFEDPNQYRRCLRMSTEIFESLVRKVAPLIQKENTSLRDSISPAERLSVTLTHLATGQSQVCLSRIFRLGQSTISGIIKETCAALYAVLKDDHLKFPNSQEEWKAVAQDYGEQWNFHHCIGAMDGRHFRIDPPLQSGSLFYNYKETFSVVLVALVDADLRFIFVDVGMNGRVSDRGIWNRCGLKSYLENNIIPSAPLPGTNNLFPFVVVADEGFTLSESVLIPYPKALLVRRMDRRIFNYRLSRARRTSENAFGVLVNRFEIFRAAMRYDPDDATTIILAVCCLHNMLRSDAVGRAMYTPTGSIDVEDVIAGTIRRGDCSEVPGTGVVRIGNQGGNRHTESALNLRDRWCEYFNGPGAVPWQLRMVTVANRALPQ